MLARIRCQVPLADSQGGNTQITRKDAQVPSISRRRWVVVYFLGCLGPTQKQK